MTVAKQAPSGDRAAAVGQAGASGGPAARRGRPGHDTTAVIDAGIGVFIERGYDGATMDDVAAVLGIAKSSVYHHVSGKEEILQRALDRALGALEAVFDEVAGTCTASGRATTGRLEAVVRRSVATLVTELPSVTLLLRVRGNSDTERAALARRRAIDARFANLVIQAQADGAIRADLDPRLIARLVFGTVNSLTEWYRSRADGEVADTLCALIFDGLRGPVTTA